MTASSKGQCLVCLSNGSLTHSLSFIFLFTHIPFFCHSNIYSVYLSYTHSITFPLSHLFIHYLTYLVGCMGSLKSFVPSFRHLSIITFSSYRTYSVIIPSTVLRGPIWLTVCVNYITIFSAILKFILLHTCTLFLFCSLIDSFTSLSHSLINSSTFSPLTLDRRFDTH